MEIDKEEYGIFNKEGLLVDKCDDFISAIKRSKALTIETGFIHSARKIDFTFLSNEEKLDNLSRKLKEHKDFLDRMKGSGRSYYGDVRLKTEEMEWLLAVATEKIIDKK